MNKKDNDISSIEILETFDFSEGMVCDLETGICGTKEDMNSNEEKKVEKKTI